MEPTHKNEGRRGKRSLTNRPVRGRSVPDRTKEYVTSPTPLRLAFIGRDDALRLAACHAVGLLDGPWAVETHSSFCLAMHRLRTAPPAAILLDVGSEPGHSLEYVRELSAVLPAVPVAVAGASSEASLVILFLQAGARAYLAKPTPPRLLARAISEGYAGWPLLCRQSLAALVGALRGAVADPHPEPLTGREREVLGLLQGHMSDKEMAAALGVGLGTVHSHLSRLYRKLGVHTRAQALASLFPFSASEG